MKRKLHIYLIYILLLNFLPVLYSRADTLPLAKNSPPVLPTYKIKGAVVAPFGTPIFNIYTRIGSFTPEQRAAAVEQILKTLGKDPYFQSDSVKIVCGEVTCDVIYGDAVITSVDIEDAHAEGATRELVANARKAKIIYAIKTYRTVTSFSEIIKNVGISLGVLVVLIILITLINKLFRKLNLKADHWQDRIMKILRMRDYDFFNRQRQVTILLLLFKIIKWFIILILLIMTMLMIFYLLPWTKAFSIKILGFAINPIKNFIVSLWEYLPNFVTIIVILLVTRLVIRLFKFFKVEVEKETLKIPGFYPDWALPTFNIFRVLIIIFTIVAIWPYLPGSGSQVFQGVSVFFGLVFSLTSVSALSNFMAGLTLTYTRAFKLGDRVKIGDVTGDIIEKSMLVTKIRTIKNEEITVPNTKIMNSEVINFSTCAPGIGLIMHTTVTIGYDAPWRQVHQLLTDAAQKTELILKVPKPFVLQTALNDFYVSYQLNVYTRSPNQMAEIYSNLHKNIQDSFNQAGVEIMSPHYKALRDGNTIAIPQDYREKGYKSPTFRVQK